MLAFNRPEPQFDRLTRGLTIPGSGCRDDVRVQQQGAATNVTFANGAQRWRFEQFRSIVLDTQGGIDFIQYDLLWDESGIPTPVVDILAYDGQDRFDLTICGNSVDGVYRIRGAAPRGLARLAGDAPRRTGRRQPTIDHQSRVYHGNDHPVIVLRSSKLGLPSDCSGCHSARPEGRGIRYEVWLQGNAV